MVLPRFLPVCLSQLQAHLRRENSLISCSHSQDVQPNFTGPSDHRLIFDTINKLNIPPLGCFLWVSFCSSHAKVINTNTLWLIILTLLYDRSQKSLFNWCIKPHDAHLPIPLPILSPSLVPTHSVHLTILDSIQVRATVFTFPCLAYFI